MRITRFLRTLACLAALATPSLAVSHAFAAPPSPVTFQQIVDYLNLEVKEEKILQLLENSPAVFTLGQEQIQQLKQAGASDRLIAAMMKPGAGIGAESSDIRDFVFVLDCSGSMKDAAEPGVTKWQAAQRAAIDLVQSVPEGRRLAVIIYGHDLSRRCQSVDLMRDLQPIDAVGKQELIGMIQSLKPAADTPIAASLHLAGKLLSNSTDLAKVVLITDGMETCHCDPMAEAAKLAEMRHLMGGVDVIGFGLRREEVAAVAEIAKAGRGEFFNAETVGKLRESVQVVERKIAPPVEAKPNLEVLSAYDQLLIRQLSDDDGRVRAAAAEAVAKRRLLAAVPRLMEIIAKDGWTSEYDLKGRFYQSDYVRETALETLQAIAPDAIDPALSAALDANVEPAWAARKLVDRKSALALPSLAKFLNNHEFNTDNDLKSEFFQKSDSAKEYALAAMLGVNPEAAEQALVEAASSSNPTLREWATRKLGEITEAIK